MKKIALVAVIGAAVAGYAYTNHYIASQAKEKLDEQLIEFTRESGMVVSYQDLSADFISEQITLDDVNIVDEDGQSVADIEKISMIGFADDTLLEDNELTVEGLKLDESFVKTLPNSNDLLTATFNMKTEAQYLIDDGEIHFHNSLVAEDIATLEFSFSLSNSKAIIEATQEAYQIQAAKKGNLTQQDTMALQQKILTESKNIVPVTLEFALENEGQLKAVIEQILAENNIASYSEFEETVNAQLKFSPLPDELKTGISNFIAGTEELSIKIEQTQELTVEQLTEKVFMSLGQPEKIHSLIKLDVEGK